MLPKSPVFFDWTSIIYDIFSVNTYIVPKIYNQIMNKILMNAANSTLGARSYETPAVTVVEVVSEGVLCASGQLEGWYEEDLDW